MLAKARTTGVGWLSVAATTGLGLVLAAMPLALWVAWSPAVFVAVIVAGASAAAALILHNHVAASDEGDRVAARVAALPRLLE